MGTKISRRNVTDQEFSDAFYGGRTPESKNAASDNRGILRGVSSKFVRSGKLDEDEGSSCELMALWRCLQYHDVSYGQKFTTSLHRFCVWECCKELQRKRRKSEERIKKDSLPLISRYVVDEHDTWSSRPSTDNPLPQTKVDIADEIENCLRSLPYDWQRTVIKQYYLSDLTCEAIGFQNGGYSKETARLRLDQALTELRTLCQCTQHTGALNVANEC